MPAGVLPASRIYQPGPVELAAPLAGPGTSSDAIAFIPLLCILIQFTPANEKMVREVLSQARAIARRTIAKQKLWLAFLFF